MQGFFLMACQKNKTMKKYNNATGDSPDLGPDWEPDKSNGHVDDVTEGWVAIPKTDPTTGNTATITTTTTTTKSNNSKKIAVAIIGAALLIGLFIYYTKR